MGKGKKKQRGKETSETASTSTTPSTTSTQASSGPTTAAGPSQATRQQTQPTQKSEDTSASTSSAELPAGRRGPPPAGGRGGATPAGGRGGATPAGGRGGPPPAGGRGGATPAGGRGGPPPAGGRGGPPPAVGRGGPPPAVGRGGPPPVVGRGGPPPAVGRGGPPPAVGRGQGPWQPIAQPIPQQSFSQLEISGQQRPAHPQVQPPPAQPQVQPPPAQPQVQPPPPQTAKVQPSPGKKPQATPTSTQIVPRPSVKQSIPSDLAAKLREQIPCRRNPMKAGTKGRPIWVETNMLSITVNQDFKTNAVHYDVTITPDKPKFLMRPVFEALRRKHFPNRYPAFDGKKNAFSANDLPFKTSMQDDIEVFDQERQETRTFNVQLQKVNEIDLSWIRNVRPGLRETEKEQIGLQVIDIIMRHGPAMHCVSVGKSFFYEPQGRVISLSNGLDLWVGTFQSVALGWKPYLNIDVAHKGFPTPQNVIALFKEMCQNPRDRYPREVNANEINRNERQIERYLSGIKVQYEIPGRANTRRTFRVNGLAEAPRNNRFKLDDGRQCTVQEYFEREKGYRIQHGDLPCLWVGSRDKRIYVPPELCTIIAGQATTKKMDETQTSNMIRQAATNTELRKKKIMDGFAAMRLNDSPAMKEEFRLSVQGQFEKVPARVLNAPNLQYGGPSGRTTMVRKGVWRAENFLQPAQLPPNSWTILNLQDRFVTDRDLYNFQSLLQSNGQSVGMAIGNALTPFTTINMPLNNINNIMDFFEKQKQKQLLLIIVIIPERPEIYSKVKQITELQVGVLTQCLKDKTLQKLSPATVVNILLKINSKLNGINHTFASDMRPPCLLKPCIIFGADVTHPSPDTQNIPSIAAVAASHDPKAFQYNIEIRLQPPRTEIIQNLTEIIVKQLKSFFVHTRQKPLRVIFYRDGVSEGELIKVMHHEILAIKRAFKVLQPDGSYNPPLTFLVVQKRHHVRLFPTDKANSDDRNFNVQAGTIVDTHITHPSHIDFYLVSHASIQGTARPTKYRCICNETNDTEDDIEQLTYYLCHMFSRCTRSVSYPTPTYYAHLAAFRARALIQNVDINLHHLDEEQRDKLSLKINEARPMFFV